MSRPVALLVVLFLACDDDCKAPEGLDLTGLWGTQACGASDACDIEQNGSRLSVECRYTGATCTGSVCGDREIQLACESRNGSAYECTGTVSQDGDTVSGTCTGPIVCSATFRRVGEP